METLVNVLMIPPLALLQYAGRAKKRKLRNYLDAVTPISCLEDLDRTLGALLLDDYERVGRIFDKFAVVDARGVGVWNNRCFTRFIQATQVGNPTAEALRALLWQAFCFAAYFPTRPPSRAKETLIDSQAFKRAIALLPLRGFELLGTRHDGGMDDYGPAAMYQTYERHKIPRVTRIIFESFAVPAKVSQDSRDASTETLRFRDCLETVYFTQPVVKMYPPFVMPVEEEPYQAAAGRVLGGEDIPTEGLVIHKKDLEVLLQQFLLLQPEERRLKDGLYLGKSADFSSQRTGDVQSVHLLAGSLEDEELASVLADNMLRTAFDNFGELISFELFRGWCIENPIIVFFFFETCAAFFESLISRSLTQGKDQQSLPTPIANLLCFLDVVSFLGEKSFDYRCHDYELRLQLDLQASTLVYEQSDSSDASSRSLLHDVVSTPETFHVLLIRTRNFDREKSLERHFAIFVSPAPPGQPDEWGLEMSWHAEGHRRSIGYAWRSSIVQIQPDLVLTNHGGMKPFPGDDGEALMLRAHEDEGVMVVLDLNARSVKMLGLEREPGAGQLELEVTDLQCYRLPRRASQVRRHPSKVPAFDR